MKRKMSLICVKINRECNGCMSCRKSREEFVYCELCGDEIDIQECYQTERFDFLCVKCLLSLHKKI